LWHSCAQHARLVDRPRVEHAGAQLRHDRKVSVRRAGFGLDCGRLRRRGPGLGGKDVVAIRVMVGAVRCRVM